MSAAIQREQRTTTALEGLRRAADRCRSWPPMSWRHVGGEGSTELELRDGTFADLELERGNDTVLETQLEIPAGIERTDLVGDRLELTIDSLYPIDLEHEGVPLAKGDVPPVALGPVLLTIADPLAEGDNGVVRLRIRAPDQQLKPWWIRLDFTTPRLRERFEVLDVAWARLLLAAHLAASEEEEAAVGRASALVGRAPEMLDGPELDDLAHGIEGALAPLAGRAADVQVHVIGHCHIDLSWLWTWEDTTEVIKRDLRSALELMDEFPEMTLTHSQPAAYESFRRAAPEAFERIVDHIASGRWEPATMTWVEGDTNMASGEAHARQLLHGVRYTRDVLGTDPVVFLAPDTFGHAGNLPQLATSAGTRVYYHHRCNPGGAHRWPAYWWEGKDGSRILAVSTSSYNGQLTAGAITQSAVEAIRNGHRSALFFHGIGDHGGGPTRLGLETLRRCAERPGLPSARCSTLRTYADEIRVSGAPLPVHRGESSTIFEGCYSTQGETKRFNREGENLLTTADALTAITGVDRRRPLSEAWRTVLFNQFHDILDGSSIHEVHAEQHVRDHEEVKATATDATDAALDVLEGGIRDGDIAVTNPLGFDREDVVTVPGVDVDEPVRLADAEGRTTVGQPTDQGLCFVARVSAFGTASYEIVHDPPVPAPLEAVQVYAPTGASQPGPILGGGKREGPPYLRIDTEAFRAYVRRDCGVIVSLYDRRAARELVGYGMRRSSDYIDDARPDLALGVLQLCEEHPHGLSAWHLDEVFRETSILRGASTEVVEAGPVRLVLLTTHHIGESLIQQQTVFYRDLPRIDYRSEIDWREHGGPGAGVPNLKVAFTAELPGCEAWYETPFAACRRPAGGREVPALRWADVGDDTYGIALLNDCRYGYDALGNRLRLTLVRSAYEPDAVADLGHHSIAYSLLPHPGSWRDAGVVETAAGFNQPLIGRIAHGSRRRDPAWRPKLDGGSTMISGVKRNREGLVVRIYETVGRTTRTRLTGLPSNATAWETNLVEDRHRRLTPHAGEIELTFRPWQVRTLLVEDGTAS